MKDNREILKTLEKEYDDKWEEQYKFIKSLKTPETPTQEEIKFVEEGREELHRIIKQIKEAKDDEDRLLDRIKELKHERPKRENQRVFFLWILWIDEDGDPYWRYHSTWDTLEDAEEERYYIMKDYTVRIVEKAITPDAIYFQKEYKKGLDYD